MSTPGGLGKKKLPPITIEGRLDTSKREALKHCKGCQGFVSIGDRGAASAANITVLCQRGGTRKHNGPVEGVCHAALTALARLVLDGTGCPNHLDLTMTHIPEHAPAGQARMGSPPAPHSP